MRLLCSCSYCHDPGFRASGLQLLLLLTVWYLLAPLAPFSPAPPLQETPHWHRAAAGRVRDCLCMCMRARVCVCRAEGGD